MDPAIIDVLPGLFVGAAAVSAEMRAWRASAKSVDKQTPPRFWVRSVPTLMVAAVALAFSFYGLYMVMSKQPERSDFASLEQHQLTEVRGRTFFNESVPVDGHRYVNCTFIHVNFVYKGTATFGFIGPRIEGPVRITTRNDAATGIVDLLQGLGFINPNLGILNRDMKPRKGVEALQTFYR